MDATMWILLLVAVVFFIAQLINAPYYKEKALRKDAEKQAQLRRRQARSEKPRPKSHRR